MASGAARSRPRLRAAASRPRRLLAAALTVAVLLGALVFALTRPQRAEPPSLGDLWSGRASLVLARKWTSSSLGAPDGGAYAGSHVEVVNGTWYLFNRRNEGTACSGQIGGTEMGTQVRASTDRGRTWGPPVTILAPTPGTPWSCAATDGDAVYDADAHVWRYLFQCLGTGTRWSGCYAERHDESPLGPFSAPAPDRNPVIAPGQLWSQICDPGDECAQAAAGKPIADEGTFNVFDGPGSGWWVGFHGYDGTRGYRGLARTTTFQPDDWLVDGAGGTPTDAVLDVDDITGWREDWQAGGPVGVGAASVLEEGGWYYQLAEAPDENLTCTPGQTWDLGLFRTRDLASTSWAQYPRGNPIVYSSRAPDSSGTVPACNVEYPNLFRDGDTGVTYLMHGRVSSDPAHDAIYVYRIAWDHNLIDNGDFASGDAEPWRSFPGTTTQRSVERAPDGSPDGTPYLALNCGSATCAPNAGIYQDVAVPPGKRGDVAFGGTFRGDTADGRLDVVLHQLDGSGRLLSTTTETVAAGQSYRTVRRRARVDPRARTLRLQIYPRTPITFRADNLFVIPQDGCSAPSYPTC